MAAPSKRPHPAAQLRERLEMARDANVPFDTAWERAWSRIHWPHDTTHRRSWKKALGATRETWESSYNGVTCDRHDLRDLRDLTAAA